MGLLKKTFDISRSKVIVDAIENLMWFFYFLWIIKREQSSIVT